jgi:YesN/AraC family two-component response regulator
MSDDSKKIRILAVDDHPILRQGISALIEDESDMAVVAEAANGREAIQQFRTHHPDITLMDLQMPEMNGLDAMIAISRRSNNRTHDLHRRRASHARSAGGRPRLPFEK